MIYESQKKALNKYLKKAMKPYTFRLHKEKYKDVIEWLDQQKNRTGYILELIKEDMKKNKK